VTVSTKPWRRNALQRAAALTVATLGAACAGPAPEPGHSFSEVRLQRVAPPPAPVYLQAPHPNAVASAPPVIADSTTAAARVRALLTQDGFTVETQHKGETRRLTATRMGTPEALRHEAACALKALHRPNFSASDVDVLLAPSVSGLAVQATSRFVLIDTSLLSGDLTRQTCRSNGALEAAVRRAAAG
jgi:hypothetical protein